MSRLSVILIVRNEASRLAATLAAVRFADEIVVVDSGSTDETVAIARRHADTVIETTDWPGFGAQKNRALDAATGDWVLSIDADETVTPALAEEIRAVLVAPRHEVYALPRLSSFLGRPMRHGGWWPDYVPRLFRRGAARFSDDLVHERLVFEGPHGRLSVPLQHESIRDLDQMIDKMNHYTHAGAERLRRAGRQGSLRAAIGHGLWAFVRVYLLRRGFLDGREGFIMAVSSAESAYYRYLKRAYGA